MDYQGNHKAAMNDLSEAYQAWRDAEDALGKAQAAYQEANTKRDEELHHLDVVRNEVGEQFPYLLSAPGVAKLSLQGGLNLQGSGNTVIGTERLDYK